MEFEKIINLLDKISSEPSPKFMTRKWIEVFINQMKHTVLTKTLDLKHHS